MFVYSGFGTYKGGENYLMTDDTDLERPMEVFTRTMMSLTWIQDRTRRAAAASILILDSNFPDLDKLKQSGDVK
jgi:hypothetical protein